jgi:anaerobic magnesium-protoporphyrin IX monomethyl ester cyclase
MKVMLSCPSDSPFAGPFMEKGPISIPLGLAYLGAYVKDLSGVEIVGFDNNALKLSVEEYRQIFLEEKPDVVAISILTPTVYRAWEMARVAKEAHPSAVVIVGGAHCSALPEDTLQEQAIDYGVVGEGEEAFREFILALRDKQDLKSIRNLVYRSNGRVIVNPKRPRMIDLDHIPLPAREIFGDSKYGMNINRRATSAKNTTVLTSRGCPYGCIFCSKSVYGREFYQRSPQNVIEELKSLEEKGYGEVLILDDTFTVRKSWVVEFCRLFVEQGLKTIWNCHARVDTIDEDVVKALKQARCSGLAFGIETGNPDMMKKIGKNITLDQARTALKLCRQYGLTTLCSYIFGHPGDTWKSVRDTLRFSIELDSDYANFSTLFIAPGSEIFEEARRKKTIAEGNWDHCIGQSKELPDHSLCELTPLELQQVTRKAFRQFYFRPRYIWRKLQRVRSFASFGGLIRGAYLVLLFQLQDVFRKFSGTPKKA